ncbi:MAG: hypothetical protein D6712_09960 [Chloroflexi bacterium]|nr:MAG: hypothetical protein D6712_09960 [Chloroflexota bacterium]
MMILVAILGLLSACTLSTGGVTDDAPISGPPVVEIISPQANATYLEGVDVNILARITNAGADISRVEVTLDGAPIGTLESPNTQGAPAFNIQQTWVASGTGAHTIVITAYRSDGSSSAPATVMLNVVTPEPPDGGAISTLPAPTAATGGQTAPPTATTAPAADAPTIPPPNTEPTQGAAEQQPTPTEAEAQAQPTSAVPMGVTQAGVNVRSGPSTVFAPIGSLAANSDVQLAARNPAGDWYKIYYYNDFGWVYAPLLQVSGNIESLPVDAGPPPPTATPIPPSPVPQANVNLTVSVTVSPHPLVCNQTSNINITITNNGSEATTAEAPIAVQAILVSNGQVLQTAPAPNVPVLGPGQSAGPFVVPITVSVNYEELQRIVVTVDAGNTINETDENDNVYTTDYVLAKGACP